MTLGMTLSRSAQNRSIAGDIDSLAIYAKTPNQMISLAYHAKAKPPCPDERSGYNTTCRLQYTDQQGFEPYPHLAIR